MQSREPGTGRPRPIPDEPVAPDRGNQQLDAGCVARQAGPVDHVFTLAEARGLLPDVLTRADELIGVRADLVELQAALARGESSPRLGGLPEAKGLQARLSELLGWFPAKGLELKSIAPLLLDFPSALDDEPVLLCWLEGERALTWYHKPAYGFAGRRPIPGGSGGGPPSGGRGK